MRSARRLGIAAWLLGLAAGAAWAQTTELAASEAVKCLTPAAAQRGQVDFPFALWKDGASGSVKVELNFASPTLAPEVKLLAHQGDAEFVDVVRRHVAGWRVPCMAAGARPVKLVQDFAFSSSLKAAVAEPPQDAGDVLRSELLKCMQHTSGTLKPEYPMRAMRAGMVGRVLVNLVFRDPAGPPEVRVDARPAIGLLRDRIEEHVAGLRLPCLSGEVVSAYMVYAFRIEDDHFGFKPLTLSQLLGSGKGIRDSSLRLDTTTMGCPFDLRFSYFRPAQANEVQVVGPRRPEQRPLLDLLAGLELALPSQSLDAVFADTTTVTVPCLKIDLTPQGEKS